MAAIPKGERHDITSERMKKVMNWQGLETAIEGSGREGASGHTQLQSDKCQEDGL